MNATRDGELFVMSPSSSPESVMPERLHILHICGIYEFSEMFFIKNRQEKYIHGVFDISASIH
jgi:hypothetical protein